MFATDNNAFVAEINNRVALRLAKEGADITKAKHDEITTGQRAMTATINVDFIASHSLDCDLSYFDAYAKGVREVRSALQFLRTGIKCSMVSPTTYAVLRQIVYIANKRKDKLNSEGKLELLHTEVQKGLSSVIGGQDGIKYEHNRHFQTKDSEQTTGAQSSLMMVALALLGLNVKVQHGKTVKHVIDVNNSAFDTVRALVIK